MMTPKMSREFAQAYASSVGHLFDKHNLFTPGLEKSGSFVEHAAQIGTYKAISDFAFE
jgi:hypothetical protein